MVKGSREKGSDPKEALEALHQKIKSCTLCRLSQTRTNSVPGFGKIIGTEVVFVGEGPGRNEDLEGKPFVGAGGKLLDELLSSAGLKREDAFITNIVKCRPPGNRKPESDEVEICTSNYLETQIELLRPLLICTLGATALEYFTGETRMGEWHGKLMHTKRGIALLPTYHPASIFRKPEYKQLLQQDLAMIPKIIAELKNTPAQSKLTSYV